MQGCPLYTAPTFTPALLYETQFCTVCQSVTLKLSDRALAGDFVATKRSTRAAERVAGGEGGILFVTVYSCVLTRANVEVDPMR